MTHALTSEDCYAVTPIKEVDAQHAPPLSELTAAAQPLVMRGIAGHWALTTHASQSPSNAAEYLTSFYNGRPSMIYRGDGAINGRYFYNEDATALNYQSVREPVDAFLMELTGPGAQHGQSLYMASAPLDQYFPSLKAKVQFDATPHLIPDAAVSPLVNIWVGNRSLASCHFDGQENIACCVAGRRRVVVFPPDQIANLYPGPIERTPGGQVISMVDFAKPDYSRFPKFQDALKYAQCTELEPGDGIFIPSMWWHQIEGLSDFNILVNYWWSQAPSFLGSGMPALYHAMLAVRDRPVHEKAAFKALFDYYVFGETHEHALHIPPSGRGVLDELTDAQARRLRALIINQLNK